jgi:hypothetical protein
MTGIFHIRRFGKFFPAVVVVFLALQKVHGEGLYLALVGPPPLRFDSAAAIDPVVMGELALPEPKDTKATITILPPESKAKPSVESATNSVTTAANPSGSLSDAAKSAEGLPGSAPYMLSIMPRMMTEYFKPNRSADDSGSYQPGDTIYVPAELQFVPPMPGQNRAIYESR